MLPRTHFLFGFFISIIIFILSNNYIFSILFLLSSFLIDFDHYLYFVIKEKSLSLKRAYKWFRNKSKILKKIDKKERKNYSTGTFIFHGIEWLIIFLILGRFVSYYFYAIFLGMFVHLIMDWIEKITYSKTHPRKISVVYDIITKKSKKSF